MNIIAKILKGKLWLLILLISLGLINWLASIYHARMDFTNEKRFSLSPSTKKILHGLEGEVEIKIFLKGSFPSGFRRLANTTEEMLQEFKEVAGNNLKYKFINPDDVVENTNIKWGDTLSAMDLIPINLKSQLEAGEQQQLVYPIALISYKDGLLPIRIYNGIPNISNEEINAAEAVMEYQFVDAIYKLSSPKKSMIAYSSGNGEPPIRSYATADMLENVLLPSYVPFTLNINNEPIPDTFKLLLIVKPTQSFTEIEKLRIDQFVMHGGKLLLFVDKLNAEMDSLRANNEVVAYDRNLELNDLLFHYGVRINSDLVMDLQCDQLKFLDRNNQEFFLKWNYFPVFASKSDHAINRNLDFVSAKFVNSIDTVEAEGITKTVLLSSSSNARKIGTPALISSNEIEQKPVSEKYKTANIPVAYLLEGKFSSLFKNRLSQDMSDTLEKDGDSFLPENISNNKMIIVADGDIVMNGVTEGQPIPMGMNVLTYGTKYQYKFANRDFLQNCLEYLIDQSGLSEVRAKNYKLRLLDSKKINKEKTSWQLINIAAPILAVILFALIFQWIRRRRYSE